MKSLLVTQWISLSFIILSNISLNTCSNSECAPLMKAVRTHNTEAVKTLLKTIDPDCVSREQDPRTPLVLAARKGYFDIAKLLIDAGADVQYHAMGDETPLMAAAANGHLDIVTYLVEEGGSAHQKVYGDGTALLVAARGGHLQVVTYLISQGVEVDKAVTGDGTPLICAVRNGHYNVAKVLLENGANPHKISFGDENAMYHAHHSNNKEMIALLENY